MKKTFYITTSIPYVNAAPHIGHAEEFVQADIIARYQRLLGKDVRFLSGTDDNALKNVLKADEAKESVGDYVSRHATIFKNLLKELEVSNDDFIQTSTDPRHFAGAKKLWEAARADIYEKNYKGVYCVGCEEFKMEKDLVDGKCPEHPSTALETVEEKNYFFNLKKYENTLKELISSDTIRIVPEQRKKEVLSFIQGGLEDFSISRSKARARGWGVPVPGDESQVMYVWFDALANYITALGYADDADLFQKYWTEGDERVHVIGKGITRFHAIYWPAMLLSAGIKLPTTIFVHGYLTVDGQKMSKSLGNVVDPFTLISEFEADAFRYFIAREISTFEDSDFTAARFKEAYNANLANGIGNLASRILKLTQTHLEGAVDRPQAMDFPLEYAEVLEAFEFNRAADYVWARIQKLDQRIADEKPYELVKTDAEAGKRMLCELAIELYEIARLLQPLMPETSEKIKDAVLTNKKPENLFPRLG